MRRRSFTLPASELNNDARIYMRNDGSLLCSYDAPQRHPGKLAHDQMPRRRDARDQEGRLSSEELQNWLQRKLDPEDYADLCEILGIENTANETLDDQIDRLGLKTNGRDRRPPPMTEQDEKSFHERYR